MILDVLLPWEFSLPTALAFVAAASLYALGILRGARAEVWQIAVFAAGLLLMYGVMQTRFDYYAQYLFSAHRAQHVVLHHLGPFLIALAMPAPVFAAALPTRNLLPSRVSSRIRRGYRLLQNPWIAGGLFVGLIGFWLTPGIHFDAMLSRRLYWLMNWSMAVDGLLFWWLVFARSAAAATPRYTLTTRLLLLVLIVPPQLLLGAGIAFSERPLFDVYDVCGRALAITPLEDQQLGGLLTWIPPAMMSMAGVLILLARHLRDAEHTEGARWRVSG